MNVTVVKKINPAGEAAIKALAKLKGRHVKVGWPGGGEVAEYAMYNELGTSRIPARPFLKSSFDENKGEIENFIGAGLTRVGEGGSEETVLSAVGMLCQQLAQDKIDATNSPPNAPGTIRQKGSSHPLIDNGTMKNTLTFEVE